jgi:hypothetical protein
MWLLGDHIKHVFSHMNKNCIIPESLSVHQNLSGKERTWRTQGLSGYITHQQVVVCEVITSICPMRSIFSVCIVCMQVLFIFLQCLIELNVLFL